MGRVYNALVKSERWKDSRAFGRPISRNQQNDSRSSQSFDDARWNAPTDFEQADFESATAGDFDQSSKKPDPPAQEEVALSQASPAAPRMRIASVPAPPSFAEPRLAVNVLDLEIEPHLAAVAASDALAAERFRTLAVRILNLASRRKLKTLLVTSAQEGEGKSTIAANLAWVMAKRDERRVLLIDADARRPSIGRLLGINAERGWMDLIAGNSRLEEAAIRIDPNGLYVLTPQSSRRESAQSDYSPEGSDALTSSRVEELLRDLEHFFDFILIDSPPLLEFADSQRLASIVDGAMLVVRAGSTHHEQVTDALKLIPKERRLGVALNGSQIEEEIAYYKKRKTGSESGRRK
jgi:capsular exopolysaccharide synthesis family protein